MVGIELLLITHYNTTMEMIIIGFQFTCGAILAFICGVILALIIPVIIGLRLEAVNN